MLWKLDSWDRMDAPIQTMYLRWNPVPHKDSQDTAGHLSLSLSLSRPSRLVIIHWKSTLKNTLPSLPALFAHMEACKSLIQVMSLYSLSKMSRASFPFLITQPLQTNQMRELNEGRRCGWVKKRPVLPPFVRIKHLPRPIGGKDVDEAVTNLDD